MLAEQEVGGHASVHDDATASSLGLAGAPIEGPTHFSQFDPLAVTLWGQRWFTDGCISAHFQTVVVEGEEVQAQATTGPDGATIRAVKRDGSPVLTGTMSVDADVPTELRCRLARGSDTTGLQIIDRLQIGATHRDEPAWITRTETNGAAYPFSLDSKLERITEAHPWYTADGGAASPWGAAIVPIEMISVLAHKRIAPWPVRQPALGLFLDLEVRLDRGPVLVDHDYLLEHTIVGLGQSRRTESYWTETVVRDAATGEQVATVLLHSGVFKESYPGYRGTV